jgi:soluble lytic murein transglycosylase-like protein
MNPPLGQQEKDADWFDKLKESLVGAKDALVGAKDAFFKLIGQGPTNIPPPASPRKQRGTTPYDAILKPYEPAIEEAAREYQVKKNALRALIMKESSGVDTLRGKDGEFGLMQVLPRTAVAMGIDTNKLMDPRQNILAGAKIYADILKHVKTKDQAAMSYNRGWNNVVKGRIPSITRNDYLPKYKKYRATFDKAYGDE